MPRYSPLRARLASFHHAYALAIRLRNLTGCNQYIVQTDDPFQPIRVVPQRPPHSAQLLAAVL